MSTIDGASLAHDLDIAPPSTIRAAIHDFAAALVSTREFMAFEEAAAYLKQDTVAQAAIEAYRSKRESLGMMLMLNAVDPAQQAELDSLRETYVRHPSVRAYSEAQFELTTVCQRAANLISQHLGLDFVAASGSGCCAGGCAR